MGRGAWWATVHGVAMSQTQKNSKHYSKLPSLWQLVIAALETRYRVLLVFYSFSTGQEYNLGLCQQQSVSIQLPIW